VKAAEEALEWSDLFLSESTQSYEGSMESYRAGLQSIFNLIQAQRNLADARIKQAQAKTQWLISLAELAFATGSGI
jgi:outer membrane protein TolC